MKDQRIEIPFTERSDVMPPFGADIYVDGAKVKNTGKPITNVKRAVIVLTEAGVARLDVELK